MPCAKKWTSTEEEGVMFWCPGCEEPHSVPVTGSRAWQWNANLNTLTLAPSILVTQPPTDRRCHSFVREGRIEFLSDCSHVLAGQTVDLPEWDMTKPFGR